MGQQFKYVLAPAGELIHFKILGFGEVGFFSKKMLIINFLDFGNFWDFVGSYRIHRVLRLSPSYMVFAWAFHERKVQCELCNRQQFLPVANHQGSHYENQSLCSNDRSRSPKCTKYPSFWWIRRTAHGPFGCLPDIDIEVSRRCSSTVIRRLRRKYCLRKQFFSRKYCPRGEIVFFFRKAEGEQRSLLVSSCSGSNGIGNICKNS